VAWNLIANDFGVFQVSAQLVFVQGFSRLLDVDFISLESVGTALGLLEKAGQWIPWMDRATAQRWAIFPRWGDEQTAGNPALNRDPLPPSRILAKCSLKTREFFAKHSREISPVLNCDSLLQEGQALEGQEGGEGVQGEGADFPPELAPLAAQLYAVIGYPRDPAKDLDLLKRAVKLYEIALVRHVIGAWCLRRQDDPLRPQSRPRVELWNWLRKQRQWDDERRQRDASTAGRNRRKAPDDIAQSWKR
jgi:hypothetical protein